MVVLLRFGVGLNLYCTSETGVTMITRICVYLDLCPNFGSVQPLILHKILMGSGFRHWVLVIPPFIYVVIQLAQNGVLGFGV